MNALKNKVHLIGNVGSSPEIKTLETGGKEARFSIATNETYRNSKGEKVKETQWHSCVAHGKAADIVGKFVTKGGEIAVEGKLVSRHYTDIDGIRRYKAEIHINELLLLGTSY